MPAGDVKVGVLSTVTDQTNIIRDISEAIDFLSPFDTPFLNLVGRDSLSAPCEQLTHEWLEDQLGGWSGTLAVAYVAGSGQMQLTAGQGTYLLPEDTILIESTNCVYQVTGGAPDLDVLTVAYLGGAADTAAALGAAWRKLSYAGQEGGEARADMKKVVVGNPYNYTQIIKDWAMVTGTMKVIKRYGYASERAYQEDKILKRLAIALEQTALYGVRSYVAGPPRRSSMGGLLDFVLRPGIASSWDTVINAAAAALTEDMLGGLLQAQWTKGGMPDFIAVNGTNKRVISSWGKPFIRTERGERTAGASIGVYESDFGTLDVLLVRFLRPSDVIVGTRGSMGLGPLTQRQFGSRLLPVTGDYERYEILGEYTMEVHKPTIDWGWLYNLKTTY